MKRYIVTEEQLEAYKNAIMGYVRRVNYQDAEIYIKLENQFDNQLVPEWATHFAEMDEEEAYEQRFSRAEEIPK